MKTIRVKIFHRSIEIRMFVDDIIDKKVRPLINDYPNLSSMCYPHMDTDEMWHAVKTQIQHEKYKKGH